jgi:hypothetical protein
MYLAPRGIDSLSADIRGLSTCTQHAAALTPYGLRPLRSAERDVEYNVSIRNNLKIVSSLDFEIGLEGRASRAG